MEHKSLSRRSFLRLAAGVATGALLAACAPKVVKETVVVEKEKLVTEVVKETVVVAGTPKVVEKEVTKVVEKVVEKKVEQPINLQVWHYPCGFPAEQPQADLITKWGEEYKDSHPNVTVQQQALGWDAIPKVQMATVSGNPPNVILRQSVDSIINAVQGGVAIDFDLPDEFVADLPKGWYEGMKYMGKNYQVPFYTLGNGMVLNLTLIRHFGAEDLVPKAPERAWNFDQYLELMKRCTGKGPDGKDVYGAAWMASQSNPFYYWPEQVMMWGWPADDVEYKDGKWRCKLADEESIAFLKWWQECYTVHHICPNPSGFQRSRWEMWDQQELISGIGPDISWCKRVDVEIDQETLICKNTKINFEWIFVRCPNGPKAPNGYVWGGPKLDVNSMPFKTKYDYETPVSVDFCLFMSNREHQKFIAKYLLPARLSAVEDVQDNMLKWHLTNYIPYGRQRAAAVGGQSRAVCESLQQVIERLFLPMPPDQAIGDFCQTIETLQWVEVVA